MIKCMVSFLRAQLCVIIILGFIGHMIAQEGIYVQDSLFDQGVRWINADLIMDDPGFRSYPNYIRAYTFLYQGKEDKAEFLFKDNVDLLHSYIKPQKTPCCGLDLFCPEEIRRGTQTRL